MKNCKGTFAKLQKTEHTLRQSDLHLYCRPVVPPAPLTWDPHQRGAPGLVDRRVFWIPKLLWRLGWAGLQGKGLDTNGVKIPAPL